MPGVESERAEVSISLEPVMRNTDPAVPSPLGDTPSVPRRAKIRRNHELRMYGYTPGCPGCDAALRDAELVNHSEICRSRIEAATRDDDEGAQRLEASAARRAHV